MAKMNKTQAVEAAKQMARNNEQVKALPLASINKMDWARRRDLANQIRMASPIESIHTDDRYRNDVAAAFVDAAMSVWGNKVRELETRRRSWRRACEGITYDQARAEVVALLTSMNIRGGQVNDGYIVYFRVERAEVEATLTVKIDRQWITMDDKTVNPDDESQWAGTYEVSCEVGWSSTNRSLSNAEVALKVYREVVDAAHEVQCVMERRRIIWTHNVPTPEAPKVEVPSTEAVEQQVLDARD